MLNVNIAPHREFLPANSPNQKLFVMLKLRPTLEAIQSLPATSFIFLIDTSGSMYEIITDDNATPTGKTIIVDGQTYDEVKGGKSRIDMVIESLQALIHSQQLTASDRISIIQFDDRASTIIDLTPATEISQLENAIAQLRNYSGGTQLGLGMKQALKLLENQEMSSRRVLIFTDGQTFDEDECKELAQKYAQNNIPITALGMGEYAEDLLINLGDNTGGRVFHVELEKQSETAIALKELPQKISEEFSHAQKDVITNLALTIKTVKGVQLTRIARAYPEVAEYPITNQPYYLGNAEAGDETVFILEFNLDSRADARIRLAQLGLTYDIPGKNRRGELPPQNLILEFVSGYTGIQVDQEVMSYVQQCNISQLIQSATSIVNSDPQTANEILERAKRMTQKVGNRAVTQSLSKAQIELRQTRRISDDTRKTIKMGAKSKTVKINDDELSQELDDELIAKIAGI